jgi:hypothetical protein
VSEDWRLKAVCQEHDANLWNTRAAAGTARHICASHCPVKGLCKQWAHAIASWRDQTIGGEWWVETHDRVTRPSKMQPPCTTEFCTTCRPDAPKLPPPEDPPVVRCPECDRGVGLDPSGALHWHLPPGTTRATGTVCAGTGVTP